MRRRAMGGMVAVVAIAISQAVCPPIAIATPGDLDPSFGDDGIVALTPIEGYVSERSAVVIQEDGKIVIGLSGDEAHVPRILRLLPGGQPDSTFGTGGSVIVPAASFGYTADLSIEPTGDILAIAGRSLWRYLPDGRPDPTFGSGGQVLMPTADFPFGDFAPLAVAVEADGLIVVAGHGGDCGSAACGLAVARFLPDGSPDTSFGGDGSIYRTGVSGMPFPWDVAIQPDGKIVVVGQSWAQVQVTGKWWSGFGVERLEPGGRLDPTFGRGGITATRIGGRGAEPNSIALRDDGAILTAGGTSDRFEASSDFALVLYGRHGFVDRSFGDRGRVITDLGRGLDIIYAMAFTSDGEIVVAGGSGQIGGRSPASVTVAMYRPNGSLDPRFGRGGIVTNTVGVQSWATGLAIQPDGKIVIVGPFVAEVGMPDGLGAMRFQSA